MPSTVQPYVKPRIKNPADDPVIAMSHDRRAKELKNESQRRLCSNVSGVIVQRELQLKKLEKEIQVLADGVHEYKAQIDLLQGEKQTLEKRIAKNQEWCDTFDSSIGPFEEKYETSKAAVKTSYDYAKSKYKESLQKLIDDFGFHPTFKRWFDEF